MCGLCAYADLSAIDAPFYSPNLSVWKIFLKPTGRIILSNARGGGWRWTGCCPRATSQDRPGGKIVKSVARLGRRRRVVRCVVVVRRVVVWCGVVWCGLVWCGVVRCASVRRAAVWCGV